MQRFTELRVWALSHRLVLSIYALTTGLPREEKYGLAVQLRRAAVSIPTNLAEGAKRRTRGEYARFINIAEGSLAEIEYLVLLGRDLGYVPVEKSDALINQILTIGRMLHGLRVSVEGRTSNPSRR